MKLGLTSQENKPTDNVWDRMPREISGLNTNNMMYSITFWPQYFKDCNTCISAVLHMNMLKTVRAITEIPQRQTDREPLTSELHLLYMLTLHMGDQTGVHWINCHSWHLLINYTIAWCLHKFYYLHIYIHTYIFLLSHNTDVFNCTG
jgi:hypothetical protein